VIGYDDIPTAAFSAPRLTSVHTSWHAVTLNGLNDLLNRCYDLGRTVSRSFPVEVTFRASLAKASSSKRGRPEERDGSPK
jgi:LacI family transcriptional regulator